MIFQKIGGLLQLGKDEISALRTFSGTFSRIESARKFVQKDRTHYDIGFFLVAG